MRAAANGENTLPARAALPVSPPKTARAATQSTMRGLRRGARVFNYLLHAGYVYGIRSHTGRRDFRIECVIIITPHTHTHTYNGIMAYLVHVSGCGVVDGSGTTTTSVVWRRADDIYIYNHARAHRTRNERILNHEDTERVKKKKKNNRVRRRADYCVVIIHVDAQQR